MKKLKTFLNLSTFSNSSENKITPSLSLIYNVSPLVTSANDIDNTFDAFDATLTFNFSDALATTVVKSTTLNNPILINFFIINSFDTFKTHSNT